MDDGDAPESAPQPDAGHADDADDHHVIHEGVTMALYISVSLLALLVAPAHWLAFRVSSLFVGRGDLEPAARRTIGVQALAGY